MCSFCNWISKEQERLSNYYCYSIFLGDLEWEIFIQRGVIGFEFNFIFHNILIYNTVIAKQSRID